MATLNPTYKEKGFSTTNFELNQINRQAISEAFNDLILERNPYLLLTKNDDYASAHTTSEANGTKFKFRSLGGNYIRVDGNAGDFSTGFSELVTTPDSATDIWFVYNQASKAWFVNLDIKNSDATGTLASGDNVLVASPDAALDSGSNISEVIPLDSYPAEGSLSELNQRNSVFSETDLNYLGLFRITASPLNRDGQPTIEIRNLFHNPSYSYVVIDDNPPTSIIGVDDQGNPIQADFPIYLHKRPVNPVDFKKRALVGEISTS